MTANSDRISLGSGSFNPATNVGKHHTSHPSSPQPSSHTLTATSGSHRSPKLDQPGARDLSTQSKRHGSSSSANMSSATNPSTQTPQLVIPSHRDREGSLSGGHSDALLPTLSGTHASHSSSGPGTGKSDRFDRFLGLMGIGEKKSKSKTLPVSSSAKGRGVDSSAHSDALSAHVEFADSDFLQAPLRVHSNSSASASSLGTSSDNKSGNVFLGPGPPYSQHPPLSGSHSYSPAANPGTNSNNANNGFSNTLPIPAFSDANQMTSTSQEILHTHSGSLNNLRNPQLQALLVSSTGTKSESPNLSVQSAHAHRQGKGLHSHNLGTGAAANQKDRDPSLLNPQNQSGQGLTPTNSMSAMNAVVANATNIGLSFSGLNHSVNPLNQTPMPMSMPISGSSSTIGHGLAHGHMPMHNQSPPYQSSQVHMQYDSASLQHYPSGAPSVGTGSLHAGHPGHASNVESISLNSSNGAAELASLGERERFISRPEFDNANDQILSARQDIDDLKNKHNELVSSIVTHINERILKLDDFAIFQQNLRERLQLLDEKYNELSELYQTVSQRTRQDMNQMNQNFDSMIEDLRTRTIDRLESHFNQRINQIEKTADDFFIQQQLQNRALQDSLKSTLNPWIMNALLVMIVFIVNITSKAIEITYPLYRSKTRFFITLAILALFLAFLFLSSPPSSYSISGSGHGQEQHQSHSVPDSGSDPEQARGLSDSNESLLFEQSQSQTQSRSLLKRLLILPLAFLRWLLSPIEHLLVRLISRSPTLISILRWTPLVTLLEIDPDTEHGQITRDPEALAHKSPTMDTSANAGTAASGNSKEEQMRKRK